MFAKPMRPVTFWGMWLLLGPPALFACLSLGEMFHGPFTPKTLVPIVTLSAMAFIFAGVLTRVTRHYVSSRKAEDDDEGRG